MNSTNGECSLAVGACTVKAGSRGCGSGAENWTRPLDREIIIINSELDRHRRVRVRLTLNQRRGVDLLHVRLAAGHSWRRAAKGISIEPTLLAQQHRLLDSVNRKARTGAAP